MDATRCEALGNVADLSPETDTRTHGSIYFTFYNRCEKTRHLDSIYRNLSTGLDGLLKRGRDIEEWKRDRSEDLALMAFLTRILG
jgi:hypothetical protein